MKHKLQLLLALQMLAAAPCASWLYPLKTPIPDDRYANIVTGLVCEKSEDAIYCDLNIWSRSKLRKVEWYSNDKFIVSKKIGNCPRSHPYAYLLGKYCCGKNVDCHGGYITFSSACCGANIKCVDSPCFDDLTLNSIGNALPSSESSLSSNLAGKYFHAFISEAYKFKRPGMIKRFEAKISRIGSNGTGCLKFMVLKPLISGYSLQYLYEVRPSSIGHNIFEVPFDAVYVGHNDILGWSTCSDFSADIAFDTDNSESTYHYDEITDLRKGGLFHTTYPSRKIVAGVPAVRAYLYVNTTLLLSMPGSSGKYFGADYAWLFNSKSGNEIPENINRKKAYLEYDANLKPGRNSPLLTLAEGTKGYVFLGKFGGKCISDQMVCPNGITVMFWLRMTDEMRTMMEKDSLNFILTSGGSTVSSRGFTIIWRGGRMEINVVAPNGIHQLTFDPPTTWFHFAFTFDSTTYAITYYQFGVKVKDKSIRTSTKSSTRDSRKEFIVGTSISKNGAWGHFEMDELVVYERILTESEIWALVNDIAYHDLSCQPQLGKGIGDDTIEIADRNGKQCVIECYKRSKDSSPEINGATFKSDGSSGCKCIKAMKRRDQDAQYKSCLFNFNSSTQIVMKASVESDDSNIYAYEQQSGIGAYDLKVITDQNNTLYAGNITMISMSCENITNGTQFCIHWGEDKYIGICDMITIYPNASHQWTRGGDFNVMVIAYDDSLSLSEKESIEIKVLGLADSISFEKSGDLVAETSKALEATFLVYGNGMLELRLGFVGLANSSRLVKGSVDVLGVLFVRMSDVYYTNQTVLYHLSIGAYSLSCNSLIFTAIASVEKAITFLNLSTTTTYETHSSHLFNITTDGTNITGYSWNFTNQFNNHFDILNGSTVNYTFGFYGNYTIDFHLWNAVSSMSSESIVEVQDKIAMLDFIRAPFHTEHKEITMVTFVIAQGTGANIWIDFGLSNSMSPFAENVDATANGIFGRGKFLYPATGAYNLTVNCVNDISNATISTMIYIEEKITGLSVDIKQENFDKNSVNNYIEVNEQLTISVSVKSGSNLTYEYNFGDRRPSIITTNPIQVVSYRKWQVDPPYILNVTAFNTIYNETVLTEIYVERPLQNLSNFRIIADPVISSEKMKLNLTIDQGDYFSCTWNMSDASPLVYTDYEEFLIGTFVYHQFSPGVYNVSVYCENRLFNVTISVLAYSYSRATEFYIDVYSNCSYENKLSAGKGYYEDIYNINCPIVFIFSDQGGTSISYLVDFGYEIDNKRVSTILYENNQISHLYVMPDADMTSWTVAVTVKAFNNVSEKQTNITFTLVSGIKDIVIKEINKELWIGTLFSINAAVFPKAYKPCYTLEFDDKAEKGKRYKRFLFGDESCSLKEEYSFHVFLHGVNLNTGIYTHIHDYSYDSRGSYNVTIVGKNAVSTVITNKLLKVDDYVCHPPMISWGSGMATQQNIKEIKEMSSFFKCKKYAVRTKVKRNCLKPYAVFNRIWTLHKISLGREKMEILKSVEIPANQTIYTIKERSLEYGFYHLRFHVSMWDTMQEISIADTNVEINGFFEIKKCDLVVTINGGSGKAVVQNGITVINASGSHNPDEDDVGSSGLQFKWFCKQDNANQKHPLESFPENLNDAEKINYPESIHPAVKDSSLPRSSFKGCFGNGVGLLVGKGHTDSVLELDTDYMLPRQSYTLLLLVENEEKTDGVKISYELEITPKVVPIVEIHCKLNCLKKKNLEKKISLTANCINCNGLTPLYSWNLLSKNADAPNDQFENMTEFLKKHAATNIEKDKNLVLKPNSLPEGKLYVFKLFAYWNEKAREEGSNGFSLYLVALNDKPKLDSNDSCNVQPEKGIALETKFYVSCARARVIDEDMPFTYSWFYSKNNISDSWKVATFPSQGIKKSDSFLLSAGNSSDGNIVYLKAVVADFYGTSMDLMYLTVEVSPQPLKKDLVDNLLNDGAMSDPGVMGNVMNVLLDSMDDGESDKDDEEKGAVDFAAVKSKMIGMVSEVTIDSPAGCAMVADTLNGASDENAEYNNETMANSLNAVKSVTTFASELDPDGLAGIAARTLSATSKLTAHVHGDQAADNLKGTMEAEAFLTSGMASNMVAGEPPSSLKTANGLTKVQCIDSKDKSVNLDGFALPDMEDDSAECAGATNTVGKNRYGFSKSSSSVYGNTMGLSLSSGMGKKKKVENLTEPIRLVIPNTEPITDIKSYIAYCELMRVVHLVECNVNSSNIFMKLKPWYDNFTGNFFLFMNKGTSPSLIDHQQNCTLPNPYPDNFENMTEEQKNHFENEERWRCFITQTDMNETCIGRWCVGVIYYTNETNQTAELKAPDFPEENAPCDKLNYTFFAYTRSCLYWDDNERKWSGEGCKVSSETKDNETVCYCDHLTDFGGGGPFAEPNPIDFGSAFAGFSKLDENPTVFSVVLALIFLYFLLLLWARRKDKKDFEKSAIITLPDNHPRDSYFFEISVQTGYKSNAGTTSNIFCILYGTKGETGPRQLFSPSRKCFDKADNDKFLLAVPNSIGDLREIQVWHNNSGESPGWFLVQVQVYDDQRKKLYQFYCNKWFDVAEEEGLISRTIEIFGKEDLMEFNVRFMQSARKNLYDGHIWLSVFTKPVASTYTRVQRLSTCFSLLLTTMLANAMFYTGGVEPPSASIHLGPVTISISQIRIGITSSLIVIPIHILIVMLFKKAGPKSNKNPSEDIYKEADSNDVSDTEVKEDEEESKEIGRKKQGFLNLMKTVAFAGREDDADEMKRKSAKPLPHWLIYIAYLLVFITCAVSAFFVILYGFSFGKLKSDKWIVSMLVSFCQSVFIFQPLKVVIISLIFAVLVENLSENENKKRKKKSVILNSSIKLKIEDSDDESEYDGMQKTDFDQYRPPDEKRLLEMREQRLKEKKIKIIIKEVISHVAFVVLTMMVGYAASDPWSYRLGEGVIKLWTSNGVTSSYFGNLAYADEQDNQREVPSADGISTRLAWFDWARYSVIEYLFPIGWYNGDKDYLAGFVADSEASKVLAMARFRQLRVKPMSCVKHSVFKHLVVQCNAGYSMGVEDRAHYSAGWEPPLNKTMRYRLRRGKRKSLYMGLESPWRYASASDLDSFPFIGRFAVYNGASYSVSIGPKKRIAKRILSEMKDNFWVDRYTRAIITEANIYNANTNLLLIVTHLHEILPTGGWNYYNNIQSLRLYRYVGGLGSIIILFDIIFVVVTIVSLYKSIKACRKVGFKEYICNPWNLFNVIVVFSSLGAIICTIGRFLAVKWAVEKYAQEPELFVSFAYVGQLEYFIMAFIGFVMFFCNIEFLRILRFNRRIGMLTKTIGILGPPMASFAVCFSIVFMGYISFGHCLFVDKLEGYSSFVQSTVTLFRLFMGQFSLDEFLDNAPYLGTFFFFSYMIVVQMILINLFVGIICDAFAAIQEQAPDLDEPEVASFITTRMKKMAHNSGISVDPIYTEWKSEWDLTMEKISQCCDKTVFLMKYFTDEDLRLSKWFDNHKKDSKMRNVLAAIIGSDCFIRESELCNGIPVIKKTLRKMTFGQSKKFLYAAAVKRRLQLEKGLLSRNERTNSSVSFGSSSLSECYSDDAYESSKL